MGRPTVADRMAPVVHAMLGGDPPVAIRFWDGSAVSPAAGSPGVAIVVRSRRALRRMLWAPGELGLARAYVTGDIDVDGDMYALLDLRNTMAAHDEGVRLGLDRRGIAELARAALALGAVGPPPRVPPEEVRLHGARHSKARDASAVRSHYDVGNDFYRLVLGPTMTYSCAYWDDGVTTLDDAQEAKYEHICRKLGLQPGMRLLDVGCGWGGMVLHAAREYGVEAVGITLSPPQRALAARRVEAAGLGGKVEVRVQDYRELGDERFDAISSIGMFEHVGSDRLREYASALCAVLKPGGRLLNHGISRPAGPAGLSSRSFINRYVFPDGELHEVGAVVSVLQEAGLEVRDVESLREHYARTLRSWVANLEAHWDEAVAEAGASRARIWRLYMAGCAINFEEGRTMIHQVLGVRQGAKGASGMPATRRSWYGSPATTAVTGAGGRGSLAGNGGRARAGRGGGAQPPLAGDGGTVRAGANGDRARRGAGDGRAQADAVPDGGRANT
jgi:cyclopropane-fatty-acyl-phospholipid synthase